MHKIHHIINTNIGKRIYHRRKYLEISLKEFSSYSGIAIDDLIQIERGTTKVTVVQLFKISHALHTHISHFFKIQQNDEAIRQLIIDDLVVHKYPGKKEFCILLS